jgi:hypothetical protein
MIGEVLGSYSLECKLGEGGMGEVYLATHRRIARRAAVKVLLPEFSREPEILNRFFNEARTTSLIDHPNIVEVLDCDVHPGGRAFIVMEYLHGESLAAVVRRVGNLGDDVGALCGLMAQIAGAVGAAHAKGIIHRDLKPDNIFLLDAAPVPLVKILDFGIAKLAAGGGLGTKTRTGSLLGTPLYMSPEQCRGSQVIDRRTDIYSLGCVLYELLTGRAPFVREGAGDLIVAHVTEPPVPPSQLNPSTPRALEELTLGMLAKAAEQRPASMDEVAARIAAIAAAAGHPPARLRVVEPSHLTASYAGAPVTGAPVTGAPVTGAPVAAAPPARMMAAPEAGGTAVLPIVSSPGPSETAGQREALRSGADPKKTDQTTLSRAMGELAARSAQAMPSVPPGTELRTRRRALPLVAGGALVVAGLAAVGLWRGGGGLESTSDRRLEAPSGSPGEEHAAAPPPPRAEPSRRAVVPPPAPPPPEPPVETRPATITVEVEGAPPGLTVIADGEGAEVPLSLPRDDRSHRLVFRAPGHRELTRVVAANRDQVLVLAMEPEPPRSSRPGQRGGGGRPPSARVPATARPTPAAARSSPRPAPSKGPGSKLPAPFTDID